VTSFSLLGLGGPPPGKKSLSGNVPDQGGQLDPAELTQPSADRMKRSAVMTLPEHQTR